MGFPSLFKHHSKDLSPPPSRTFRSNREVDEDLWSLPGEEWGEEELVYSIIRNIRSHRRLFFEPTGDMRLIVENLAAMEDSGCPFEEGVAVVVETSEDPYIEFKVAMEEMAATRGGMVDCKWLQEMLEWYLRVNSKENHVFIVEAFADLILQLDLFALTA